MRAWGIRALFAGLLLATLAARIQASHEPERDVRPAIVELLASSGISARADRAYENSLLKAVTFDAPQCKGSVHVFPIDLSLQEAPLFGAAVGAGREQRIAYLGRTWSNPSRIELRVEWLKQKGLSALGLGTMAANTTALLIAAPKDCERAQSIDWAPLWR